MGVRLKTMPYEIDGQKLTLCCNMDVLADLQEQNGELQELLESRRSMRSYLRLLAAMINSELRARGQDASYTDAELGRRIGFGEFRKNSGMVFGLLISAVEADEPEAAEKNAVASRDDGAASTLPGT